MKTDSEQNGKKQESNKKKNPDLVIANRKSSNLTYFECDKNDNIIKMLHRWNCSKKKLSFGLPSGNTNKL